MRTWAQVPSVVMPRCRSIRISVRRDTNERLNRQHLHSKPRGWTRSPSNLFYWNILSLLKYYPSYISSMLLGKCFLRKFSVLFQSYYVYCFGLFAPRSMSRKLVLFVVEINLIFYLSELYLSSILHLERCLKIYLKLINNHTN